MEAKLTINVQDYKKGLKDAERQTTQSMNKMTSTTKSATSSIDKMGNAAQAASAAATGGFNGVVGALSKIGPYGKIAAAAIALIGGAVMAVVKTVDHFAQRLNDVAKTAKSVNMTANAYLSLQHACSRAGIQMQNVLTILNKIDYAMIHSAAGEQKYVDAFYKLGIAWEDLEKLSPEKRLMAINDAMTRIKMSGQTMPKELFEIFGRKDMQTLNKMQAEGDNFNKFIAEAGALGYNMPQSAIETAEAYADSIADGKARLEAIVNSMKEMEDITKNISNLWGNIVNKITTSAGFVNKEYRKEFEGIGDAGKRLFTKNSSKLTDVEKREFLHVMYQEAYKEGVYINVDGDVVNGNSKNALKPDKYNEVLGNMDAESLADHFEKEVKKINWAKIGEETRKQLFSTVAAHDARFDANNQNTWVQKIPESYEDAKSRRERLAQSKANSSVRMLLNQMKQTQEYYDKADTKAGKLLNIDEEILKINNELQKILGDKNAKLDKELENTLRINAALLNQKALQNEINTAQQKNANSFKSFYSGMLSNMGANKQALDQFFESLSNLSSGTYDFKNMNLLPSLNWQHLQMHNLQKQGENNKDYYARILKLFNDKNNLYTSVEDFAKYNPEEFWTAFKRISDEFNENKIDTIFSDEDMNALERAMKLYNDFVAKTKTKPPKIDLDLVNQDSETAAKNYDLITDALKGYEAQMDLELSRVDEIKAQYFEFVKKLDEMKEAHAKLEAKLNDTSLTGEERKNLVSKALASAKEIHDFETKNANVVKAYSTSITRAVEERDKLQVELKKLDEEEPNANSSKLRRAVLATRIGELTQQIDAYKNERSELETALTTAQSILTRSKFTSKFKDINKDYQLQHQLETQWQFRQSAENTEMEAKQINAELSHNSKLIDEIQQQILLRKAGIAINEKNLEIYKEEFALIKKANEALKDAKANKAYSDKYISNDIEGRLQRAKAAMDLAEIKHYERLQDLKSMGIDPTPANLAKYQANLDALERQRNKSRNISLMSSLDNQADSMTYSLMEKQGKARQAAILKAVKDAEQQYGPLSQTQTSMVEKMAELQYSIDKWKMPQAKEDVVYTNDLARRGGFNSSVVVETENISRKQLAAMLKLESLVSDIKTEQARIQQSLTY